ATVGIYSAALRIADASTMPIRSLNYSTYGRFFGQGAAGVRSSLAFAMKLPPISLAVSVVPGIALLAIAPFATLILGPAYQGSTPVLLVWAIFPTLYALRCLAGDVLVSSDHVWVRSMIQVAVP